MGDIQKAIKDIGSMYKDVPVRWLSDESVAKVEVIPTGSLKIDSILGVGGFPRGRFSSIIGWESSGKSTLALHTVVEAQKMGGYAAYIDSEHALDRTYMQNLGIDPDRIAVTQPDYAEQSLEMAKAFVLSGEFDVIVLDSIAAMSPQAEVEGDITTNHLGVPARLMSKFYRNTTPSLAKSKAVFLTINQYREKIGVMFGDPRTTPGGHAEKFYSSIRLETRKTGGKKDADNIDVHIKCLKNKVAAPFKECDVKMVFGLGIDRASEVLDLAVEAGVVQRSGSWYSYMDEKVGQGEKNVAELLRDNDELAQEIMAKVLAA